jgi:hypothetical protein
MRLVALIALVSASQALLCQPGKTPALSPGEFARSLPPSEAAELVADFTSAYHDLRYGGRPEAAARMIALLGRIEHATPPPRT